MIITVITVRMVEVAFNQVVGVVAVRNSLVSASRPVFVALFMSAAIVVRGTRCRVLPAYADLMLVNVIAVCVVEVPIVKIILMAVVLHGRVSAVRTMHVSVRFVYLMIVHFSCPYVLELEGSLTAGTSLACARALKTRSITCWSASP